MIRYLCTALVVAAGSLIAPSSPASALEPNRVCDGSTRACQIGDIGPGGGVIFFDAGVSQPWGRYLEAAPPGWHHGVAFYAPSQPQILRTSTKGKSARIRWSRADDATSYVVNTSPPSSGCRTTKTTCVIKNLKPSTTYEITIQAVNDTGVSIQSSGKIRTPKPPPPKRPARPSTPTDPAPEAKPKPTFRQKQHVRETRQRFENPLEATDPVGQWCFYGTPGSSAFVPTEQSIGAGSRNTQVIVDLCGRETAAGIAQDYAGGGKTDWFLPSQDETAALYKWREFIGGFETGGTEAYWTSSQAADFSGSAWLIDFATGASLSNFKERGGGARIRPIRAFG